MSKNPKSQIKSLNTAVARATNLAHSPRKLRLVADAVRGMAPTKAVDMLAVLPQAAAKALLKVYKQAIANTINVKKLSLGDMKVEKLLIEEGTRGPKKADVHSHGARFNRGVRRRRYSHIYLELSERSISGTKS